MPVFIESHILNAFVTFAGQGTLTKTSEVLGISQPALTQSMKKLEDIIGVRLFHRSKNKMTLNENGMLVLDYARQIMALQEKMIGEVREKDARSHIIRYGSIAPGPIFELTPRLTQFFVGRTLQSEVKEAKEPLLEGLDDGTYDFVVLLDQPDGYLSKKLFEEHRSICLPKGHRLARRKSIEMKELDGETLLLMDGLGFWKELTLKKLPHSNIIWQKERSHFIDIINLSKIPNFVTNISKLNVEYPPLETKDRIAVPISDSEVHVTFYLVTKMKDRMKFLPII